MLSTITFSRSHNSLRLDSANALISMKSKLPRCQLAFPNGSPCPTAVIDVSQLDDDDESLLDDVVRKTKRRLDGRVAVNKFALIKSSRNPLFDFSFRFAQTIPPPESWKELLVDWSGSCGHAILASATVAAGWWLPRPTVGAKTRVEVLNRGDGEAVIAEVTGCTADCVRYTAHFPQNGIHAHKLLLTGQPRTMIQGYEASLISAGNEYVFVNAKHLGMTSPDMLFAAGDELHCQLASIRSEAGVLLNSQSTVFPKIACIGAFNGVLAVRAIAVGGFHPGLALTGLIATGAAAVIPNTIVNQCVAEAGGDPKRLKVTTAQGEFRVNAMTHGNGADTKIDCISVPNKRVRLGGGFSRNRCLSAG